MRISKSLSAFNYFNFIISFSDMLELKDFAFFYC